MPPSVHVSVLPMPSEQPGNAEPFCTAAPCLLLTALSLLRHARARAWENSSPPCLPSANSAPSLSLPIKQTLSFHTISTSSPRPQMYPPQTERGPKLRCVWLQRETNVSRLTSAKRAFHPALGAAQDVPFTCTLPCLGAAADPNCSGWKG